VPILALSHKLGGCAPLERAQYAFVLHKMSAIVQVVCAQTHSSQEREGSELFAAGSRIIDYLNGEDTFQGNIVGHVFCCKWLIIVSKINNKTIVWRC